MRVIRRRLAICISTALLSGCAAGGAGFERPTPPPPGQAMIYVYRPADLIGGALPVYVTDNGHEFTTLSNGQYRVVPVDAGHHELSVGARSTGLAIDAVAGETYYLRFGVMRGLTVYSNTAGFMRAYPQDAQNELQRCCKSGQDSE